MKTITLASGQETLVDDDVHSWASQFQWYALKKHDGRLYASRKVPAPTGGRRTLYLHRAIMERDGYDLTGLMVDHRDGCGLNNLRSNLRVATPSENGANRRGAAKGSTSRFVGVSYHTRSRKWRAKICIDKKSIYLGYFSTEEAAAQARDEFVRQNRLERYTLNYALAV